MNARTFEQISRAADDAAPRFAIVKSDDDRRLVFGWASVSRAHIIGHNEIARTDCPGPNFPFDEIIRRLREAAGEPPLPQAPPVVSVGDIVQFVGGGVHTSSASTTPAHTRGASICRVTNTAPRARNAFHLVSTDGGHVHGWVSAQNIRAIDSEEATLNCPPPEDSPTTAEPASSVNVAIGGLTLRVPARTSGGRWIMSLPEGPEGQPPQDVVLRVVLERMGLEVGWDGASQTVIATPAT